MWTRTWEEEGRIQGEDEGEKDDTDKAHEV